MKICRVCSSDYAEHHRRVCKSCRAAAERDRRRGEGKSETARDMEYQRRYGITLADYESMAAQGCWICGADQGSTARRLHVDHCHDTGRVRGVLCSRCNTGLGMFKDSPELLTNASNYLEKHV